MSERFPGIAWYCDRCNAYLNDQIGFDDTECGTKTAFLPMIFMNLRKISEM